AAAWSSACRRREGARMNPTESDPVQGPAPEIGNASPATGAPANAPAGEAGQEALHPLPAGALPLVAVRDTVLFPGTVFPLAIGRPASVRAVQHAMRAESPIGILMQR